MTNLGDFRDQISGVSLSCLDVLFAGEPSSNGDENGDLING